MMSIYTHNPTIVVVRKAETGWKEMAKAATTTVRIN